MAYNNPLHAPIHPSRHSQYSTISSALQSKSFLSPTRRYIPQQSYSKSRSGSGRCHAPITFDHPGYSNQGVQMQELTMRSMAALTSVITGAGDVVLAQTGLSRITLRIMWPGYEYLEFAGIIELNVGGYGPLTRAQLGAAIAHHFMRFVERARAEPSSPFEFNLGSSSRIRFENLVLVALVHVSDETWQAEIAADLR